MGYLKAGENSLGSNRSLTDERPHRDIFRNQFKDFEKINIKRTQSKKQSNNNHGAASSPTAPEFNVLKSNMFEGSKK
jgi:hypothetical protein